MRSLVTLSTVLAATGGAVVGLAARSNPLGALAAVVVAGLLLGIWLSHRSTGPLRELTGVAREWANGEFARRPPISLSDEFGTLADAMRALGDRLSGRERMLGDEQELRTGIMEAASEGLFAVDKRRRVIWMNVAAQRMMGAARDVPFPLDEIARPLWNSTVIEAALDGEGVEAEELQLGKRIVAVSARPLGDGGAVITLFELTRVRRLESMRRDFVANVSHEMKTPLTSIRGFADTLLADAEMPADVRHGFLGRLAANAERLQRLIDELLDLSRIESGTWVPRTREIALAHLVDDVLRLAEERANSRCVTLGNEIGQADTLVADPTAVRQILTNLVDNAIRHTPEQGVVSVALRTTGGRDFLAVRDTGSGMSPEHLTRIFERFYRVDSGRARDAGGNGLGLAIVKHLAEAHGGSARAESVPGSGTTITVMLPHRQSDESDDASGLPRSSSSWFTAQQETTS